jgi:DNA-binding NarL/FixJ family response regulator
MLCQKCLRYNSCIKLCSEVEDYVNQDNIYQRELTLPNISYNNFSNFESITPTHLSKREKQIVTLLGIGLGRKDISKLLNISRDNLRHIIGRIKNKCHEFLQG